MSYQKHTVRRSDIEAMVVALAAVGAAYEMTVIATTEDGMPLHRLAFADLVVLDFSSSSKRAIES